MPERSGKGARGYTLVEMLITITILGIAGAVVIPSFGTTGVLRVQAAVRTVVADINVAQSEALAHQEGRAVMFFPDENRYAVVEVNGPALNPETDTLWSVAFEQGDRFGDSTIESASFSGGTALIFDEMGAPVDTPGSNTPGNGGTIMIRGSGSVFRITVEAYTGRVTVTRVSG